MEVWNGLTPRRSDLSTAKAASHEDYLVLVQKIQELEQYVLDFTGNIQVMPDLEKALQKSKDKIDSLQRLLNKISLPKDVKDRLDSIEELINDMDRRAAIVQLTKDFAIQRDIIARNQIELVKLQSDYVTTVKGLSNKLWGAIEGVQRDVAAKVASLTEKLEHLESQVQLQAAFEKYNQLNK